MKILVVCQYYYPEPFRISKICEALVCKGNDVTVLTGLPNYPEGKVLKQYRLGKRRHEIINGVKVIRTFEIGRGNNKLRLMLNYFSFACSSVLKAIRLRGDFDIVFVNQLSPILMALPALAYKKRYNNKIMLYCLDLWPDSLVAGGIQEGSLIYKIFFQISKKIYMAADKIAVSSSMFSEYLEHLFKIPSEKIMYLPQYAENLYFNAIADTIKNDNFYNFVFAGNIGDMQSVETIVNAANVLKQDSRIVFHILGDGSSLSKCKKLAESLSLDNIKFYGRKPLEEMPAYYTMADAMLVTLKDNKVLSRTLPGKVQSYLAAGKPILGAINGETRHVIEKAQCGYCCDAEDFEGLADLISKFIRSNEKQKLSMNAREFYLQEYSENRFINTLISELEKQIVHSLVY